MIEKRNGHFIMTDEINFITLQNRFREIKEFYSAENYKYIHARTIENFLAYADSFSMKHQRQEIYSTLTEYFDMISFKQIDNIIESRKLFDKYIRPLTIFFCDLRGFHMAARLWIMIVWTVPIFVLLYLFKVSIYFYAGLAALIILLVVRQLYFKAQRKTYGFMH